MSERIDTIKQVPTIEYHPYSDRVRSWCPDVVESADQYVDYLHDTVVPVAHDTNVTRIIDRGMVRNDLVPVISPKLVRLNTLDSYSLESVIPQGGRWKGYSWVTVGGNKKGRIVSQDMNNQLSELANAADSQGLSLPKALPYGYTCEGIKNKPLTDVEIDQLQFVFDSSFTHYPTPLSQRENIVSWPFVPEANPYVARDQNGRIVSVVNGTETVYQFTDGRTFCDIEIEDAASHPDARRLGINRRLRWQLMAESVKTLRADQIHTETRAAMDSPNWANGKNGFQYRGTLRSNCYIGGPATISESGDPMLAPWAKQYASMNVWAITPNDETWKILAK